MAQIERELARNADLLPIYDHCCAELGWTVDQAVRAAMKAKNDAKVCDVLHDAWSCQAVCTAWKPGRECRRLVDVYASLIFCCCCDGYTTVSIRTHFTHV
eukprot:355364-Chlamydomonas_euryale.AAC.4